MDIKNDATESVPSKVFADLGLSSDLLKVLEKLEFVTPTPIQAKAIPVAVSGSDVVGVAQTGTGKTMAFGLPMINKLLTSEGKGLIIVPTRELAIQVEEVLRKIGGLLGLRTAILIGGAPQYQQIKMLQRDPHIVIATPGRLNDHLDQGNIRLTNVKILALDEADRMLDMGFLPQINKVFALVPEDRQTLLFSATMPSEIMKIASTHMKTPVAIEVAPAGTASERVTQELYMVRRDSKFPLLEKILAKYTGQVLVFTKTKYGAEKLVKMLREINIPSAEIHSNRSLYQRREALTGFKSNKYRVLVATDIASRGIDVTGIELVVNHDVPMSPDDYVHRIGRTGRAGLEGHAITFVEPSQIGTMRQVERLIRQDIPVAHEPGISEEGRPHAGGPRGPRAPYAGNRDGGRPPFRRNFGGSPTSRGPRPFGGAGAHRKPYEGTQRSDRTKTSSPSRDSKSGVYRVVRKQGRY